MEDNNHQKSYDGQANRNYPIRASPMMDHPTHQQCLDSMAAIQQFQSPMAMWHQSRTQQPSMNAMSMMAQGPTHQHNTGPYSLMLQSHGQRYYHAPMKMFHQAMPEGSQLYQATIACSKRFSEEEKQKLERVFTDETQKPTTNRKRQLAEDLGCPIPKVNVCLRANNHLHTALTSSHRTGSKTDGQGRNSCIGSKPMKPVKQQILRPQRPSVSALKRKNSTML